MDVYLESTAVMKKKDTDPCLAMPSIQTSRISRPRRENKLSDKDRWMPMSARIRPTSATVVMLPELQVCHLPPHHLSFSFSTSPLRNFFMSGYLLRRHAGHETNSARPMCSSAVGASADTRCRAASTDGAVDSARSAKAKARTRMAV